ncbi:hypothetical protein ACI3PL_27435, partial [Lacticaseibacillus paracasei]
TIEHAAPPAPPVPPKPPAPPAAQTKPVETIDAATGEVIDDREIVRETGESVDAIMDADETIGDYFERMEAAMQGASNAADIA